MLFHSQIFVYTNKICLKLFLNLFLSRERQEDMLFDATMKSKGEKVALFILLCVFSCPHHNISSAYSM